MIPLSRMTAQRCAIVDALNSMACYTDSPTRYRFDDMTHTIREYQIGPMGAGSRAVAMSPDLAELEHRTMALAVSLGQQSINHHVSAAILSIFHKGS